MNDLTENEQKIKATLIGFAAPLLWSTFPLLIKLIGTVPTFQMLSVSFSASFIAALCAVFMRGGNLISAIKQPIKYLPLCVSGIFLFNAIFSYNLRNAPPADVFLITVSWPILAIIYSGLILKKRIQTNHIAGCLLAFSGIIFIATQKGEITLDDNYMSYYILAFISANIWALYTVLSVKFTKMPVNVLLPAIGCSAILAMLLHFSTEESTPMTISQIIYSIVIGVGPMGAAYYLWNYGSKFGDVRVLSAISFIGHLIAVFLLIIFGYTIFTWTISVAFCLIIGGAFVTSMGLFFKKKG